VESGIPGKQVMNSPFLVVGNFVLELNFSYPLGISIKYLPSLGRVTANPNLESLDLLHK